MPEAEQPMPTFRIVTDDKILADFLSEVSDLYTASIAGVSGKPLDPAVLSLMLSFDSGMIAQTVLTAPQIPRLRLISAAVVSGLLLRYHGEPYDEPSTEVPSAD
jgi:hypothetical protein